MSAKFPIIFSAEFRNAEEAKAKINSLGGAMSSFDDKTTKVTETTKKLDSSFKTAALGFSAAAGSVISLGFQLDNLQQKQLAIKKAETALAATHNTVIDLQTKLNGLVAAGITSGDEYNKAVRELAVAKEREANATETLNIRQGDLTQAQLGFAMQIIPTVFSAVASVTAAHGALATAQVTTGSTAVGAAGALGVLRGALTALMAHPVILVFAGIATVLGLIITNTFGWRDAIDAWAKSVEKALPFLKPVFDFFRGIADILSGKTIPAVQDASAEMSESFSAAGDSADEWKKKMEGVLDGVADKTESTTGRIKTAVDDLREQMKKVEITAGGQITSAESRMNQAFGKTTGLGDLGQFGSANTSVNTAEVEKRERLIAKYTRQRNEAALELRRLNLEGADSSNYQQVVDDLRRAQGKLDVLQGNAVPIINASNFKSFNPEKSGGDLLLSGVIDVRVTMDENGQIIFKELARGKKALDELATGR